jgi:hypothetical protein
LHASCIDDTEAHPIPLNDADQAIACSSGAILNDRTSLANETIEEGTLPNVRSPDQRDEWEPARQGFDFDLYFCLILTHAGVPLVIDVVRYCGVAAASSAARAMEAAFVRTLSVPPSSAILSATRSRSSMGVLVPPVMPTV